MTKMTMTNEQMGELRDWITAIVRYEMAAARGDDAGWSEEVAMRAAEQAAWAALGDQQ